jgi:N-acetyl sugar amidotransferase
MPDTRPGITFDEEGVCLPCRRHEERANIDWGARRKELGKLLDAHRRSDGKPDVIIASSGGKDSTYQEHILRHVWGMHPLLITVSDWFSHTQAGASNFQNIGRHAPTISVWQGGDAMRLMVRRAFEHLGSPTWPIDQAIYSVPIKLAADLRIPLVCYGENISYTYGGPGAEDTWDAKEQAKNNVVKPIDWDWWRAQGVSEHDMWIIDNPTREQVDAVQPFYLGYFYPWDGMQNKNVAKALGFKTADNEWRREGCCENYDQIDSLGYMVHPWVKYPKFGHTRVTDVASNWIRNGYITRKDGVELVRTREGPLDDFARVSFQEFCGYSEREFDAIVDRFYNRDIFQKINGIWEHQCPVWRVAP